jgi:GNAT superfamily N-acetyltransferase
MDIAIRKAVPHDIPALTKLIDASVRGLQAGDYTPSQIEAALKTVYGVDSQLIADGTYFVAETTRSPEAWASPPGQTSAIHDPSQIVGCGGWSKRRTLFGGDHWSGRHDTLLDPKQDAAKIRAFFVHPAWARNGIGSMILEACETAATSAGFTRLEMGATLSGVPFYKAKGYESLENIDVPLGNGESMIVVRMAKRIQRARDV